MSNINLNKIQFKVQPIIYLHPKDKDEPKIPYVWEQVRPIIDGREILDQLGAKSSVVSIYEEDPHWGMESYEFLKLEDELYNGKLIIGICLSSIIGCHDIVADINTFDNFVTWKVYDAKNPKKCETFTFNKEDYAKAIEEARSNVTQTEKFPTEE